MAAFGLSSYWAMLRARGPRLPVTYFLQAHLFDLIHGTDTHNWTPKAEYAPAQAGDPHTQFYMCSWTKEAKAAYRFLKHRLGGALGEYVFVDIGCGKGKICLIWALLTRRDGLRPPVVGVEYSEDLAAIARANAVRVPAAREARILTADATAIDYAALGKRIIFYLYNPFDATVMARWVGRLANVDHLIVYVNPVEADWLTAHGYRKLWRKPGWQHRDTLVVLAPIDGGGSQASR